MSFLSNWRLGNSSTPPRNAAPNLATDVVCRQAADGEIHVAMRMVLGQSGRPASDEQVVDFLRYAMTRGIDPRAVWVAERKGQPPPDFAILPVPNPGKTVLLLTPGEIGTPQQTDAAGQLVESICGNYRDRHGMRLAQVLLDPTDGPVIDLYAAHAFRHLAELIYLQGDVKKSSLAPVLPDGWAWVNYSADTHARFASAIAASYQDSLDCPALTGMRDIEDTVAGHRAAGEFDPAMWFLLTEHGESRGVLLLAPVINTDAMELVYLGLSPAARGKGLGNLLMRQALAVTARRELRMITLAVDSRNAPALKLYFRHGLHRVASKVAMMRDLLLPLTNADQRASDSKPDDGLSTRAPHDR